MWSKIGYKMDQQQTAWFMRKEEILGQLTREELATLDANATRLRKEKGETIFLDEGEDQKLYIIDEGYARICHLTDDGKRFIIGVMGPGEFFGATTPDLSAAESEEIVEVVRNIRLIIIDARVFHDVLKAHPAMVLRLAQLTELKKRHL